MSPSSAGRWRLSPEVRAAIFHSTVFGTTGMASVYFSIWLTNRGIGPNQIGIINAAPVLLILGINVLVGRIADRARDWRSVILVLALIGGIVPIAMFFVSGFWAILLFWTLAMLPGYAVVPVIDAATLRMTRRRGTDFGGIRAWGTVGFMVVTAVAGPIIGWAGDGAFVPLFVLLALARAIASLQLPEFRAGGEAKPLPVAPAAAVARAPGRLGQLLKPWFVSALLGLGIVYSTHGAQAAFGALLWRDQGVPEALIGPLIAVMAASEATMMFLWNRLKVKISARHLILFACLVAAARWSIMAFSPPVWLLFLLQLLHCITFAVSYFGGVYFIANWTNEDVAAEAQGFSYVLQQAMSVISVLGMGVAVAAFGTFAWLALGIYALCGAGFVLVSLRLVGPTPEAAGPSPSIVPVPQDDILP